MSLDADRLAGLARTKLEGLVRRAFPDVQADAVGFNAGVGLVDGDRAFVLLIQRAPSPLAAALAWGEQHGATELHVVVDDPDPMLACHWFPVSQCSSSRAFWPTSSATSRKARGCG